MEILHFVQDDRGMVQDNKEIVQDDKGMVQGDKGAFRKREGWFRTREGDVYNRGGRDVCFAGFCRPDMDGGIAAIYTGQNKKNRLRKAYFL